MTVNHYQSCSKNTSACSAYENHSSLSLRSVCSAFSERKVSHYHNLSNGKGIRTLCWQYISHRIIPACLPMSYECVSYYHYVVFQHNYHLSSPIILLSLNPYHFHYPPPPLLPALWHSKGTNSLGTLWRRDTNEACKFRLNVHVVVQAKNN